jgi:LysR family transcriptional regulator, hydrogen peroxide-inducible genes activator
MPTPLQLAPALSLKQLTYLLAVADTLHFTQAAEQCFVTQSTLSGGIRELERFLDAHLIERDRQHVMLTPLGQHITTRARQLLSDAADLIQTCLDTAHPLQGTVTLGAIPTIAPFMLPGLLRQVRHALPDLKVLLREEQTAELLQAVDSGGVDFAILALPMDIGRLQALPLFTEELWLIHAEDDPLAQLAQPAIAQVDLHRLMLLSDGNCLRDHALLSCRTGRRGKLAQTSDIEASSLPTLVQMVEAGLGVSLLPEMAIKAGLLTHSKVQARPLAAPAPKRDIALVMRPTSSRLVLAQELQAIAQKMFGGAPVGARRSKISTKNP